MSKQIYFPESMYDMDNKMDREKLEISHKAQLSVTGMVIRLNIKSQLFLVDLGGGITATMPLNEATIYPIYRDDNTYSPNIYKLVGKKIQAKIISLDEKNVIISRRINMVEALETLKSTSYIKYTSILAFSKFSAFIDIGAGIIGRSYGKDFSPVYFNDIKEIGLITGDVIPVTILDYNEDSKNFNLSRIKALPKCSDVLEPGNITFCKVFNPLQIQDSTCYGYYVLIDQNFCGILDSKFPLKYGQKVIGKIKRISSTGPHLSLVV